MSNPVVTMYTDGDPGADFFSSNPRLAALAQHSGDDVNYMGVFAALAELAETPGDFVMGIGSAVKRQFTNIDKDLFAINQEAKDWTAAQPYTRRSRDAHGNRWNRIVVSAPEGTVPTVSLTDLGLHLIGLAGASFLGFNLVGKSASLTSKMAASTFKAHRERSFKKKLFNELDDVDKVGQMLATLNHSLSDKQSEFALALVKGLLDNNRSELSNIVNTYGKD